MGWIEYNEDAVFEERRKIPINTPVLTRFITHYGDGDNEVDYRVMNFNGVCAWDLLDSNETVTHWKNFEKI